VNVKKNLPGFKMPSLKPFDIPVIILALSLTLFIAGTVYSGRSGSPEIIIRGQNNTWVFPLYTELELSVQGPIGETLVLLHSGGGAIISSPCIGQTCITFGSISRNMQWLACLPNRVFLLIEGNGEGDAVDAVVR
jgi:hypothetical protein